MKFVLLLFFSFTAPLVIFLTTILFASDVNDVLKKELAQSSVYDKLSEQLGILDGDTAQDQAVSYFLKQTLTPDYIQTKAEGVIDSSADWITGKSTTPPVLSFKDLKDDLLAQNPGLLASIEEMANEVKNQPAPEGEWSDPETEQANADMQKNIDSITSLAKSDFTIKLDQQLIGLKNFYNILRIIVPILAILLILSLILLVKLSQTVTSRLKWISATLIVSAILGFGTILLNSFLVSALTAFASENTDELIRIISPIVLQIVTYFVNTYMMYQSITSGVFIVTAAACLVIAGLHNDSTSDIQKVVQKPRVNKK